MNYFFGLLLFSAIGRIKEIDSAIGHTLLDLFLSLPYTRNTVLVVKINMTWSVTCVG